MSREPVRNPLVRPVTILDLRDSPWVDGPGRTILDCAESLRGTGYQIVIGAFSGGPQKTSAYVDEAHRRGLPVIVFHERGALDVGVIRQVLEAMRQTGADLVHTHDFRSNLFGLYCARRLGKPAVSTIHGWIANGLKKRIYRILDKVMLRFFDHIIAVSERTKHLARRAWIRDDRITVIPNALTVDRFAPDRGDRAFRAELGLNQDSVIIANIGRLSPEKGQLEFLQAARILAMERRDLHFVLAGIGPDQKRLEHFVNEAGLGHAVVFAGFREDMLSLYNSVDLVVQSSYTEGMPNVVLEALLMSVPVIATDVGGTGEVVEHQHTGVLIPPGDVQALITAMHDFLNNRTRHETMARAGRERILERFDHRGRVERLRSVYDEVLGPEAHARDPDRA